MTTDNKQSVLTEEVAREAFRRADTAKPMRDLTPWQIWRDCAIWAETYLATELSKLRGAGEPLPAGGDPAFHAWWNSPHSPTGVDYEESIAKLAWHVARKRYAAPQASAEAADDELVYLGGNAPPVPAWLLKSARRISQYMDEHSPGEWAIDGIQSRSALKSTPAAEVPAKGVGYDPTDPRHDVDTLREHVRHLERRLRQLYADRQQRGEDVDERIDYLENALSAEICKANSAERMWHKYHDKCAQLESTLAEAKADGGHDIEVTQQMLDAGAKAGDAAVQNGELHPEMGSVGLVFLAMLEKSTQARVDLAANKADDADRFRQWFDCIQDTNPAYLTTDDYKLARRLYEQCGMRVPNSIDAAIAQQGKEAS